MNDIQIEGLSPAGLELLALLSEECGELVQIIGKIIRHGLFSHHPETGMVNLNALIHEMGDVRAAMQLLCVYSVTGEKQIQEAQDAKLARVGKYLHHAAFRANHIQP